MAAAKVFANKTGQNNTKFYRRSGPQKGKHDNNGSVDGGTAMLGGQLQVLALLEDSTRAILAAVLSHEEEAANATAAATFVV